MNLRMFFCLGGLILAATFQGVPVQARTSSNPKTWAYTLVGESAFINDCLVCGRPTIPVPMRGRFDLVLQEENPLFSRYELRNIDFTASRNGETIRFTGGGTFKIGGEVKLQQEMTLQLQMQTAQTNETRSFTNEIQDVTRDWPLLEIDLNDTQGTFTVLYRLHLLAAPLREIWFSTAHGLTPGHRSSPTNYIGASDLLSNNGSMIKPQVELLARLGLMPTPNPAGIDAVSVGPGGETIFSLQTDDFSETLGQIHHGDLVSNRGRFVKKNAELMKPFGLMPPAPDVGLDAVQIMDNGEILFSIQTQVFSEMIGADIFSGDILSEQGRIVKTGQQLVSAFQPDPIDKDYGLDAFYIWPSGEIWFSTAIAMANTALGPILPGDLLSDRGYIVFRNLEVVSAFAPLEDLADFGLDSLFIVTDTTPASSGLRFTDMQRDLKTGTVHFRWEGAGRVFQVEKAPNLTGPFQPFTSIIPDLSWTDAGAIQGPAQGFYRVRQW